jgi:hypothetical protein
VVSWKRDNARTVPIQIAGQTAGQVVKQWTYGRAQYDQTRTGNWSVGPVTSSPSGPNSGLSGILPPCSVTDVPRQLGRDATLEVLTVRS